MPSKLTATQVNTHSQPRWQTWFSSPIRSAVPAGSERQLPPLCCLPDSSSGLVGPCNHGVPHLWSELTILLTAFGTVLAGGSSLQKSSERSLCKTHTSFLLLMLSASLGPVFKLHHSGGEGKRCDKVSKIPSCLVGAWRFGDPGS